MSSTPEPPDDPQICTPPTTDSQHFQAPDADIVFQSSDNVLFHIHRKNLETHAAGFPPSEFETCGEIVPLTEDTLTLERLFQYMYLKRHADIDLLPFEDLYKLAEAAEKYEAFSVMHLCKMGFKQMIADHPAEIFSYAFKHDYPELMTMAIPHLLDLPLDKVVSIMPPQLSVSWVRYRERWSRTASTTITRSIPCRSPGDTAKCTGSPATNALELWVGLGDKRSRKVLLELAKKLIIPATCSKCTRSLPASTAADKILSQKLDAVPKFETFL